MLYAPPKPGHSARQNKFKKLLLIYPKIRISQINIHANKKFRLYSNFTKCHKEIVFLWDYQKNSVPKLDIPN
jgi:hypothetical protein